MLNDSSILRDKRVEKVYFTGIGGYGMSALALILLQDGFDVRGSDLKASSLTEMLERAGAKVYLGHKKEQVGDAELLVYSTAIPSHNPELEEARAKGITVWHRSELLAALLNEKSGVAVAGTHGKTTTSAMLAQVLDRGGLDPTAVIGGEFSYLTGNARLGSSPFIVAEACESDNSFLRYRPFLSLVTNIEADHLEHYEGSFDKMIETYAAFVGNIKVGGAVFYCSDDPILKDISRDFPVTAVSYGLMPGADILGDEIRVEGLSSSFRIINKGEILGDVTLKVPGKHNILNALGTAAVALYLGIDFNVIKEALADFEGVNRRFERIGEVNGVLVIDDYAHHPTEVKATLTAAAESGRRVICLFQPHRYTRTNFLWQEFVEAFDNADLLLLTDIYPAGEAPIPEINSHRLAEEIRKQGRQDGRQKGLQQRRLQHVFHFTDPGAAADYLRDKLVPGDMVLTMGAGDVWKAGRSLLSMLSINK